MKIEFCRLEKYFEMFIKKVIPILLLSTLLCGCSQKDNHTTIEFASWGSKSEIDILKPILNDFEKANPDIKVDFYKQLISPNIRKRQSFGRITSSSK